MCVKKIIKKIKNKPAAVGYESGIFRLVPIYSQFTVPVIEQHISKCLRIHSMWKINNGITATLTKTQNFISSRTRG